VHATAPCRVDRRNLEVGRPRPSPPRSAASLTSMLTSRSASSTTPQVSGRSLKKLSAAKPRCRAEFLRATKNTMGIDLSWPHPSAPSLFSRCSHLCDALDVVPAPARALGGHDDARLRRLSSLNILDNEFPRERSAPRPRRARGRHRARGSCGRRRLPRRQRIDRWRSTSTGRGR